MELLFVLSLINLMVFNFAHLVDGIRIYEPDDFTAEERDKYQFKEDDYSMVRAFSDIDSRLVQSVESNDPRANLAAIPRIVFGLTGHKSDRQMNYLIKAKKLIGLLPHADKCDMESYKILAKLTLAIDDVYAPTPMPRLRPILMECRKRHAEKCRPSYRRRYLESLAKLRPIYREQVQAALGTLDLAHISGIGYTDRDWERLPPAAGFVVMGGFILKQRANAQIVNSIYKGDVKWSSLSEKQKLAHLDRYLFRPCKKYMARVGDILVQARFDAAHEDDRQLPFLTEDESFARAIGIQRLCTYLTRHSFAASDLLKAN